MNLVLNHSNLMLVNRIRIEAQRESTDLDILRFFADLDYARSRLLAFVATGRPALSSLARDAADKMLPRRTAPAPDAATVARPASPVAARPVPRTPALVFAQPGSVSALPVARPAAKAVAEAAPAPAGAAPATTTAATPGERFTAAKALMNRVAVEAGGLRATFFVLKLEKCRSRDALLALLPAFHTSVARGAGTTVADTMTQQVRALLGSAN